MVRLRSLRLEVFSDRELLALMIDLRNGDGIVTTEEIVEALNLNHEKPKTCVGIRMSWMRRYGVVERVENGWILTGAGERVAYGQLNPGQAKLLNELSAEQGLDAALALGQLYARIGQSEAAMLRRGWQYASKRRT